MGRGSLRKRGLFGQVSLRLGHPQLKPRAATVPPYRVQTCHRDSYDLSLSRLNHRLPRREAYPEVVQGTTEFHHQIADTLLPQADPVFDDATALDTTVDMLDP